MREKYIKRYSDEYREMYRAAQLYYEEGLVQSEIAKVLYVSKAKVSRLLAKARELKIVEIRLNPMIERNTLLEEKLIKKFGMKDAVIVESQPCLEEMEDILVDFAADYLGELLENGGHTGIVGSHTVNAVLKKLPVPEKDSLDLYQLIGEVVHSYSQQQNTLILKRLAAENTGITIHLLNTPVYVHDLYRKQALLQDNEIAFTFQKMEKVTIAVTDIVPIQKNRKDCHGMMSPLQLEEILSQGAVGSICGQYFDGNGRKIPSEWNAKVIALPLERYRNIVTRIGIAHGMDKLDAIFAALKGSLINVLVTDSNTAGDILRKSEGASL